MHDFLDQLFENNTQGNDFVSKTSERKGVLMDVERGNQDYNTHNEDGNSKNLSLIMRFILRPAFTSQPC